jgi:thioredoxin reductase (NADPH)
VILEDRVSGVTQTIPATAVFVLIGAEPRTQWLPDGIERDRLDRDPSRHDYLRGN